MTTNQAAVAHFRRWRHKAPNWVMNAITWQGLSIEDVEADILTAEWVPNRAMWRAQGFRNGAHAHEVLG